LTQSPNQLWIAASKVTTEVFLHMGRLVLAKPTQYKDPRLTRKQSCSSNLKITARFKTLIKKIQKVKPKSEEALKAKKIINIADSYLNRIQHHYLQIFIKKMVESFRNLLIIFLNISMLSKK
jgi:hypothetical protein